MHSIKNIVLGVTLFLIVYIILSTIQGVPTQLIIGMFSLSPFVVIYMVFRILTSGVPSESTFEDSFYEDAGARTNVS